MIWKRVFRVPWTPSDEDEVDDGAESEEACK
jgi:hypothetical protein